MTINFRLYWKNYCGWFNNISHGTTQTCGQALKTLSQIFQTFCQAFDFLLRLQKLGEVFEKLSYVFQKLGWVFERLGHVFWNKYLAESFDQWTHEEIKSEFECWNWKLKSWMECLKSLAACLCYNMAHAVPSSHATKLIWRTFSSIFIRLWNLYRNKVVLTFLVIIQWNFDYVTICLNFGQNLEKVIAFHR